MFFSGTVETNVRTIFHCSSVMTQKPVAVLFYSTVELYCDSTSLCSSDVDMVFALPYSSSFLVDQCFDLAKQHSYWWPCSGSVSPNVL